MKSILNKARKPLKIHLSRGRVLHLGPGKEGQIATQDAERESFKKLVEAGEVEIVGEGSGTLAQVSALLIAMAVPLLNHLFMGLAGFLQLRSLSVGWGEAIHAAAQAPLNYALVQAASVGLIFIVAFPHRGRSESFLEAVHVRPLLGGIAGLCLSAGSAAINYSILNIAEQGNNIVTVPLLYGGTYTLFKHMLPRLGIDVRFAADDSVEAMQGLIDDKTTAEEVELIRIVADAVRLPIPPLLPA